MPSPAMPSLSPDEIDDLLYLTRVNEASELQQLIVDLAQKYNISRKDVILAGVDPESGNSVLHYCSANGFTELLKALLDQLSVQSGGDTEDQSAIVPPAVVNISNKEGNTPLHWACLNGQLDIVKMLLDAGADTSLRNTAGHLAVFEAERAGKGQVVEYLLDRGELNTDSEDLADIPINDLEISNGAPEADGNGATNMNGSASND